MDASQEFKRQASAHQERRGGSTISPKTRLWHRWSTRPRPNARGYPQRKTTTAQAKTRGKQQKEGDGQDLGKRFGRRLCSTCPTTGGTPKRGGSTSRQQKVRLLQTKHMPWVHGRWTSEARTRWKSSCRTGHWLEYPEKVANEMRSWQAYPMGAEMDKCHQQTRTSIPGASDETRNQVRDRDYWATEIQS